VNKNQRPARLEFVIRDRPGGKDRRLSAATIMHRVEHYDAMLAALDDARPLLLLAWETTRDPMRQGMYGEALDKVQRAINDARPLGQNVDVTA